jgi:hypothetical protein
VLPEISVPRIAEISGKANRTKMKEFTGKDIDKINRVLVDVGNTLAQTTAGRMEMASNLIQMGLVQSPEQYFSVINTGRLDVMTEGENNELLLIRAENESLASAEVDVQAIATDKHSLHIREHMNVLADPDLRQDSELVARVLGHVQEHINLLQTTDPNLLAINGEQPLGPPQGTPVSPENAAPAQPNQQGSQQLAEGVANPEAQSVDVMTNPENPNMPNMPRTETGPNTPQENFIRNS